MRRQGSVERLDVYRRRKGTRKLYLPLRVPQWEEPPRTNSSPSHAAVLFDIAYAAALSRHASILVSKSAQSMEKHVPGAIGFYLATGPALIWQWWQISAFLCRFDSGDLLNEFLLVLYMILVVGQSFSIEPCAGCVFSRNMEHPAQSTLPSLSCDADINGDTNSAWPAVPAHCRKSFGKIIGATWLSREALVVGLVGAESARGGAPGERGAVHRRPAEH